MEALPGSDLILQQDRHPDLTVGRLDRFQIGRWLPRVKGKENKMAGGFGGETKLIWLTFGRMDIRMIGMYRCVLIHGYMLTGIHSKTIWLEVLVQSGCTWSCLM
jgi:hypothetical protein